MTRNVGKCHVLLVWKDDGLSFGWNIVFQDFDKRLVHDEYKNAVAVHGKKYCKLVSLDSIGRSDLDAVAEYHTTFFPVRERREVKTRV